jgi:hypothetical protein
MFPIAATEAFSTVYRQKAGCGNRLVGVKNMKRACGKLTDLLSLERMTRETCAGNGACGMRRFSLFSAKHPLVIAPVSSAICGRLPAGHAGLGTDITVEGMEVQVIKLDSSVYRYYLLIKAYRKSGCMRCFSL